MLRTLLKVLPLLLLAASCGPAEADKPVITVSIEPQRWMLERLGGDHIEVSTLLSKGGNPESYEPTFSDLANLERSRCFMPVGLLPFETSLIEKLQKNNPELTIVSVSDSIALIRDSHHGHDHGIDPHIWSSATNARIMAGNMLRVLEQVDPANAADYSRNYTALIATIDSVDSACDSLLSPLHGSAFMVWHPSLSYFARDYDLKQISMGAEGKEHTITNTRQIIDSITPENTRVFLVQKDFDTSRADVISRQNGNIPVETINPLNYHWDEELINTARAIAR